MLGPEVSGKLQVFFAGMVRFLQLCVFLVGVWPMGHAVGKEISSLAELRALSPEKAAEPSPTRVSGVVTYFEPSRGLAFIQEGEHAVYVTPRLAQVSAPSVEFGDLKVGEKIEVVGVSGPGAFAPIVAPGPGGFVLVKKQGKAPWPQPIRLARGALLEPTLDCLWVEVDGLVRRIARQKRGLFMEMASGRSVFTVIVPGAWEDKDIPKDLVGSNVRVRGVYGSLTNEQRQLIGFRIYTPSWEHIQVLDVGTEKIMSRAPLGVEELMVFRSGGSERVRMKGVVTAVIPGDSIYLRSKDGSLRVQTPQAGSVQVGQEVDAIGFSGTDGLRPVLEEAVLQPGEKMGPPEPVPMRPAQVLDVRYHGELVSVDATMVDRFRREGETLFLLSDGVRTFSVQLTDRGFDKADEIPLDSWVNVTGIALIQQETVPSMGGPWESGTLPPPQAFTILLRSPEDLKLLRAPPFWTQKRIMTALLILVITLAMTTAWLFILRKKVRSQTAIISEKVEQERVQEERTRIARELHDTLEQELAGIGLQLDLAKARMQGEEGRAKEPVELALRMLRRCQGETRRSISNLRSTQLEGGDLAKAMRYLVDELKAGTPIHLELEVVGTPQKLPGLVEHNLLRLTQEALTNGLKHSGASRIEIKIRYETLRILIEVKDDGRGFDPLGKETEKEGHFGLQGMKERAAKLGATLKIESEPGKGVCISLELPLRPRKLNGSLVSGV